MSYTVHLYWYNYIYLVIWLLVRNSFEPVGLYLKVCKEIHVISYYTAFSDDTWPLFSHNNLLFPANKIIIVKSIEGVVILEHALNTLCYCQRFFPD